ncbi:DUF6160 family protein [Marinobacter sp.]|uniref:DUF6160 family protein n=1 Tax=Marinobacter sp. TaxID=50741 RepID=UPI003BAB8FC3
MKGLKKIALATAVAAAPFAAQAELQAMDDSMMGNVTGQAGVTIELETQVSIGQFTYTDEGTFAVTGIELGGAGVSTAGAADPAGYNSLLDQLKIDIDVADDGDAIIHVGSLALVDTDGDGVGDAPAPIDWGFTAETMELQGNGGQNTVLVSGLDAWGKLGALDIQVDTDNVLDGSGNEIAGSGTLNIDAAFTVENMDFDVEFLAVGVRGMSIKSSQSGGEVFSDAELASIFGVTDPTNPDDPATRKFGLAQAGYAIVGLDVYQGDGLGESAETGVLRIDVDDVLMDVNIDETLIGGTNIGTIGIDNLHISNTKLAVYGH